jgi:(4S)-4-hydroxy-5-phosphonooxypentane-2,3-dione isomerase
MRESFMSRSFMQRFFWFGAVILSAIHPMAAHGQSKEIYAVTYMEIVPNALDAGSALLNRYGDASREQSGNLQFSVLREIGRPDRFAILKVWRDKAAADSHDSAPSTLQFRHDLTAIESAPSDERVENGLFVGPIRNESPTGAVYVLTHVDLTREHIEDGSALLQAMRADSTKEAGNLRYDVLQQANRSNHFTVVEEWASMTALEAHAAAAHTRAFRHALLPMQGALYDERRYERLR